MNNKLTVGPREQQCRVEVNNNGWCGKISYVRITLKLEKPVTKAARWRKHFPTERLFSKFSTPQRELYFDRYGIASKLISGQKKEGGGGRGCKEESTMYIRKENPWVEISDIAKAASDLSDSWLKALISCHKTNQY